MILFDYHCQNCERTFEVYVDTVDQEVECLTPRCSGPVVKQLGGKPATHAPSESSGYLPEGFVDSRMEMAHEVMAEHSICLGGSDDNHVHVEVKVVREEVKPKAKA